MYTEGLPISYRIKNCQLISVATGETLLTFDARRVSVKESRANFVATGLASESQSFIIATPAVYKFEAYNQKVVIQGVDYLIVAKRPADGEGFGEGFKEAKPEIILTLE